MTLDKPDTTTVAKRITRKICLVNDLSWHELLQYEVDVTRPEDSWSYRSWINFLIRLGMSEEQIFDLAVRRINNLKKSESKLPSCALVAA